jgi:GGDEF domain-containing protein
VSQAVLDAYFIGALAGSAATGVVALLVVGRALRRCERTNAHLARTTADYFVAESRRIFDEVADDVAQDIRREQAANYNPQERRDP